MTMPKTLNALSPQSTPLHDGLRAENGVITVFALLAVIGMVGIGAVTVDTMNYESKRVAAQDAMDRCALMSSLAQNRIDAGASTESTAAEIAEDCIEKADLDIGGLSTPVINTQNSERSATLSGSFTFDGLFPNVTSSGNTPTKTFGLSAQSKQKLPNLEISIAIDTSHSLYWAGIRDPLKVFLNTIAAPDTGNKVSVNIIPYGRSVYLGTTLLERFNDIHKPPFSNTNTRTCLNFSQQERGELGITFEDPYIWSWPVSLSGTFYPLGGSIENTESQNNPFNPTTEAANVPLGGGSCARQLVAAAVTGNTPLLGVQVARPVSATALTTINNKLNAISTTTYFSHVVVDTTGGLKWALAALDPSLRPIISGQIADGISPGTVTGRPLNYNTEDSLKVLVFITNNVFANGNNTAASLGAGQEDREIRPEYLTDLPSTVWRTPGAGTSAQPVRLSVFHDNAPDPSRPYWVTQGQQISGRAASENAQWMAAPYQHPGGGAPVRLTWREVMSQITMITLIRQLYMAPFSPVTNTTNTWSALVERFTYDVRDSEQDRANFARLCAAAKEQGVLIYVLRGLGTGLLTVQTPSDAVHNTNANLANAVYNACATSPSHAFSALSTAQFSAAIRVIASNIAQLTLTQ